MTSSLPTPRYLTAAFYLFVDLPDYAERRAPLLDLCLQRQVKGMILLAREGINSTIAGAPDHVRAVLAYLRADPAFATLVHKESWSDTAPFHRMKVRVLRRCADDETTWCRFDAGMWACVVGKQWRVK